MNRLCQHIRNYFGFSKTETNGFLVLVPLMVLVLLSPRLYVVLFATEYDPSEGDKQMLDSILVAWSANIKEPVKEEKPALIRVELKPFNPNTATKQQLQQLGIPSFLSKRIMKYRDKGGVFKIKSDLSRIYDFPDSLYQVLHRFIQLPVQLPARSKQGIAARNRKATNERTISKKAKPAPLVVDLNAADTTELKKLRGIGSGYSRRIIKYRKLLGGYTAKEQLAEVYGISDSLYQSLAHQVRVNPVNLRKLNVNLANFKTLKRHPYISYKQAAAILNIRSKKGKFRSPQDLLAVEVLDSAQIEKLKPYITF